MKQILVVLILFQSYFVLYSNNEAYLDSLYSELSSSHKLDEKITVYLELSRIYLQIDLDSSYNMIRRAKSLAKQANEQSYLASAYEYSGYISVKQDSLDKAILNFSKALSLFKEGENTEKLPGIYTMLGNINLVQSRYPQALSNYIQGIQASELINEKSNKSSCYNNIGIIYFEKEDYSKAHDYFMLAMELFELANDSGNIAGTLINFGSIQVEFGNFESAKKYYKQGFEIFVQLKNKDRIGFTMIQLANIYLKTNKIDSALLLLNNSLDVYDQLKLDFRTPQSANIAQIYQKMGESYFALKQWEIAIEYLMKSYKIGTGTGQNTFIMNSGLFLSNCYDSLGQIDSSYYYYKDYNNYSNIINSDHNFRQLAQIQLQFEFDQEKKEEQFDNILNEAKIQQTSLIYLTVLFGLIVLLLLFIILYLRSKVNLERTEKERVTLKSEVEIKNKELATGTMYTIRKNELMVSIAEKLRDVIPHIKVQHRRPMLDIIKNLDDGSNEKVWKEFEVRFQQVHTSFFERLSNNYPTLTANELRLCAFLKLNMSTKDIIAITYQSIKSVEMMRFRIRKKFGLGKDENLVTFLNQF